MKKYISLSITLSVIIGMTFLSCTDQDIPTSSPETTDLEAYNQSFDGEANKATREVAGVYWFQEDGEYEDEDEVDGASATLLRTHNNVRMTIKTLDLDPHDTYTVWWVIFNKPENCTDDTDISECGLGDLNPLTNPSILYAAGHVVGGNGKGNFAGSLREGDLSGCQPPWDDFGLCGDGLEDAQNAAIHLLVRTHGPKIPGMVNDQINTFAGGCTPGSSFGVGDGTNVCVDQQAVVFEL